MLDQKNIPTHNNLDNHQEANEYLEFFASQAGGQSYAKVMNNIEKDIVPKGFDDLPIDEMDHFFVELRKRTTSEYMETDFGKQMKNKVLGLKRKYQRSEQDSIEDDKRVRFDLETDLFNVIQSVDSEAIEDDVKKRLHKEMQDFLTSWEEEKDTFYLEEGISESDHLDDMLEIIFGQKKETKQESQLENLDKENRRKLVKIEHTFGKGNRIEAREGKFYVYERSMSGRFVFDDFEKAKKRHIVNMQKFERLTIGKVFDFDFVDGTRVLFNNIENFNPQVRPSDETIELSDVLKKEYGSENIHPSAQTYQKTIESKNWEQGLFTFFEEEYGDKENLNLKFLDPKEVIDLVNSLVLKYSKYDDQSIGSPQEHMHDDRTAMELLKEAKENKNNESYRGNGVCRNFASITKALFEAVKASQENVNKLRNTYCQHEIGLLSDGSFSFSLSEGNTMKLKDSGHAWNSFTTFSKGGEEQAKIIIDNTWGKDNPETGQKIDHDQTLKRMEREVRAQISNILHPNNKENQGEQMSQVFDYYGEILTQRVEFDNKEKYRSHLRKLDDATKELIVRDFDEVFGKNGYSSEDKLLSLIAQKGEKDLVDRMLDGHNAKIKEIEYFSSKLVSELSFKKFSIPASMKDKFIFTADKNGVIMERFTMEYAVDQGILKVDEDIMKSYAEENLLHTSDYQKRFIFKDDELQKKFFEHLTDNNSSDMEKMLADGVIEKRFKEVMEIENVEV